MLTDPDQSVETEGLETLPVDEVPRDGKSLGVETGPAKRDDRRRRRGLLVAGMVGLSVGGGLLAFAGVMSGNATFASDYVSRQLAEQRISFKAAEALSPEERGRACVVRNAGRELTEGQQAECYANQVIGAHLKAVAGGRTYAQMRPVQDALRAQIAEAQSTDVSRVPDLQRQLSEATSQRQRLFEGETLRGLLLTSYGFSTLGQKAGQASAVSWWTGIGTLALSFALMILALLRPEQARSATRTP